MKSVLVILLILLAMALMGCAHTPTSSDYIQSCKIACKGQVQKYQDDTLECSCKTINQ